MCVMDTINKHNQYHFKIETNDVLDCFHLAHLAEIKFSVAASVFMYLNTRAVVFKALSLVAS